MNRKFIIISLSVSTLFFASCGAPSKPATSKDSGEMKVEDISSYDPKRGEGKHNESNVTLGALDVAKANKGQSIAETKCMSCHKLTEERLVGPGWKGVTERRTPYWIMNFITNPDAMIDKDPEVQAQLEICLVRMPNQNIADEEARELLEFMRQNDGVK